MVEPYGTRNFEETKWPKISHKKLRNVQDTDVDTDSYLHRLQERNLVHVSVITSWSFTRRVIFSSSDFLGGHLSFTERKIDGKEKQAAPVCYLVQIQ